MARLADELTIEDVLGPEGLIGEFIPGFQARASQLAMANQIAESLEQKRSSIIEASTGIGKSFAYLVPIFLSPGKALISTGTKNLQDQLFKKDLPLINKLILSGKKIALLKGRSNYGCLYRIKHFRQQSRFQTRTMAPLFDALEHWIDSSKNGDIGEFSEIPEQDSLWFYATSNTDNCLGSECAFIKDCHVVKARRKAMDADVIVINHHLFFSDQSLKQDGFGELLPHCDIVVFDEAHQLPDVASHFYGSSLSLRQFEFLLRDIREAQISEAADKADIQAFLDDAKKSAADFRLALAPFSARGEWPQIKNAAEVSSSLTQWQQQIQQLCEQLESIKNRGRDLANCHDRLGLFAKLLEEFAEPNDNAVHWYETTEHGFRLLVSPIDVSRPFIEQLEKSQFDSVIFTSATLSANREFNYFSNRLGLENLQTAQYDSPFDYQNQALLYLPDNLPDPSAEQYIHDFSEICIQLINTVQGNCFILFTSYRALLQTAKILRKRISNPLFVQGERQRSELIESYLKSKHPVLLGTSSFWEGVDVKGKQLRLVIIDKLPFKSPGDPLYRRRLQLATQQGLNPFLDIQVPEATISLRQGVGRLIRDIHDRGMIMIGDQRLINKSYGKTILDSLPDMPITRDSQQALIFAKSLTD